MTDTDGETNLRERVLKLEMKVEEIQKTVDGLNTYMRQLHDYLNQLSRANS